MKKAALYARYSPGPNQDDDTLAVQLQECRKACKRLGLVPGKVYEDARKSGTTLGGREGLLSLIEDAKRGAFQAVVVYMWDRLGRSLHETSSVIHELESLGLTLHSASQSSDPLSRDMILVMAAAFSRDLSRRVHLGLSYAAAQGWTGGKPPYGYELVDGEITIVEERAEVVREIFLLHITRNMGYVSIATWLNKKQIPAPSGKEWSSGTIQHIIGNPAYAGFRTWNRHRTMRQKNGKRTSRRRPRDEWVLIPNAFPRIIAHEVFESAKVLREKRSTSRKTGVVRGGEKAFYSKYLLVGLLRCKVCGGGYCAMTSRQTTRRYYRCGIRRSRGKAACHNKTFLRMDEIDSDVIDALERLLNEQRIHGVIERIRENLDNDEQLKKLRRELARAQREHDNFKAAMRRLGAFEGIEEESQRVEAQLQEAKGRLLREERREGYLLSDGEIKKRVVLVWNALRKGDIGELRSILFENFSAIYVDEKGHMEAVTCEGGLFPPDIRLPLG